jgi:hypothetical protein
LGGGVEGDGCQRVTGNLERQACAQGLGVKKLFWEPERELEEKCLLIK